MKSMSIRELIIEVQQQIQRAGSFKRDKALEATIVWYLNTAQDRFIKDRIKPDPRFPNRFFIDEKSRSDLQAVITVNEKLPVYRDTATRSFSFLPYDYAYMLNERSSVLLDCKPEYASPTISASLLLTIYPLAASTLTNAPYYNNVVVSNSLGSNSKSYALKTQEESFEIVEGVINQFKLLGVTAYWERFYNNYFPGSFILVQENTGSTPPPVVNLMIDSVLIPSSAKSISVTKYKSYEGLEPSNRSYKSDYLYDAIGHNYYDQPSPDSPVSQIADNRIFVYNDGKRFLVTDVFIDYIRKPRRISLYLNQSCELDGTVHKEICSLAAEIWLGNVEAPNYNQKVNENVTRLE